MQMWLIRGVSVVKQHNLAKLCCLTTLTPLISYTHNGDDTHKSYANVAAIILHTAGNPQSTGSMFLVLTGI